MSRPRPFSGALLRILVLVAAAPLANCALPPHGDYRFQAAIEDTPVAYRGVRLAEPLRMTVNFQNFSEKYVAIAGQDGRAGGIYLKVSASSPSGLIGRPIVSVGLRGGDTILPASSSASPFWFDRHNPAVEDLASTGPILL